MSTFWSMFGYPTPPDAITSEQVDLLLSIPETIYYPPLRFSLFVKAEMKKYILKNWSSRPGKKTPLQIMSEFLHDCTQEYMTGLMAGEGSSPGLNKDMANWKKEMDTAKTNEDKGVYADLIHIKLEEISKLFTEGYTGVFKQNLLFDREGRPIAVREGDDRKYRFPKCHARLAEDHAAREPKPGGIDFESSAGITAGGVRRAVLTRRKKQKKQKKQKNKKKPVRYTRRRRSSRA